MAIAPRGRPRIGITLGDPRGIGPEIVAAVRSDEEVSESAELVLIGPAGTTAGEPDEEIGSWRSDEGNATAGRLAGLAIERAISVALSGQVDALVTAPIDKAAFHAGGWHFPGHTEMLRDLTGVSAVAMMMAAERTRLGGPLRVVLATTHLPLRSVASTISADLLVQQATLTHDALRDRWGIAQPRIALCAFNPHASDGGRFGDEEARIYAPALEALGLSGIDTTGPIPADSVYRRAVAGEFDAVIAPYHDVGMAPFKTVSFGTGVNVTLGLPFPRTSPDHGTALDIAGSGRANPASMREAVRLAARLSGQFRTPLVSDPL
ncbi:MAG: 4-hydroxythreonine-4-phosphate dehydrogenase PdxA [Gemmatimonas sp.]|nr:4-hydroxythreonine-4-phosphate dehydrogenase PdxA [Gemmatimonas sp.]